MSRLKTKYFIFVIGLLLAGLLSSIFLSPASADSSNLIANSDFATLDHWTTNSEGACSDCQYVIEANTLKVTTGAGETTASLSSDPIPVVSGTTYTVRVDVRGKARSGFSVLVRSGSTITLINNNATSDGWQQVNGSFVVPSGQTEARVIFLHHGSGGVVRYIDNVSLTAGQLPTPTQSVSFASKFSQIAQPQSLTATNATGNIVVTTLTPGYITDGQCSLNEAIQAAQTDSAVDTCAAGNGADTVALPAGIITFNQVDNTDLGVTGPNALPVITTPITLNGDPVAGTLLQRNQGSTPPFSRFFRVAANGNLTLNNVSFKGGRTDDLDPGTNPNPYNGGAILNEGTLIVSGTPDFATCQFSFNVAQTNSNGGGAIYNQGTLTVNDCTFYNNTPTGNGGAIYNDQGIVTINHGDFTGNDGGFGGAIASFGSLTINDTTISQNTAQNGAGLSQAGTLIINKSTIANNTATNPGFNVHGGGFAWNGGIGAITNSTFANNSVSGYGGAIDNASDPLSSLSLQNVTIASNAASVLGGGIYSGISAGPVTLNNSLLAAPVSGGNCGNSIISNGYNIDTGSTCALNQPTDFSNTPVSLGALQNNGGKTATLALAAGSNGIDRGDKASCPATDQRDLPRPVDGDSNGSAICDIGSYEVQTAVPTNTPTPSPTPTVTSSPTPSLTPTVTPTRTPTPSPTRTPTPSITSTPTAIPSPITALAAAVEDSWVDAGNTTKNNGTTTTLSINGGSNPVREAYIKFNVVGINGPVQSAKLRVYDTDNATAGGPSVYLSGISWTETGITYATKPARISGALSTQVSIPAASWAEYDVTAGVTGNGIYSFDLGPNGGDGATFSSRTGTNPPQLVIVYGGSSVTPSPTPTITPSIGATATPTRTPTQTPSPTITQTPAVTRTPTPSPTVTRTPTPSPTATRTPTPSLSPSVSPTPVTLLAAAIEDSWVDASSTSKNNGTSTTLSINGGSNPIKESYIKFNVIGISGVVRSAKLRVFDTNNATNGGPSVYLTGTSWTELGITYANKPARTSGVLATKTVIPAASWAEYDVTTAVSGNGMYSFDLGPNGSDGATFSSREGTNPPQLVIVYGG